MLPKEKRLTNERDFKRVYRQRSFFSVGFFNINYAPNRIGQTRVGIVVSKKVLSKAVARNHLKRQFREAVKKLYEKLPKGYDVIINVKEKAIGAPFAKIEAEIAAAFEKLK